MFIANPVRAPCFVMLKVFENLQDLEHAELSLKQAAFCREFLITDHKEHWHHSGNRIIRQDNGSEVLDPCS